MIDHYCFDSRGRNHNNQQRKKNMKALKSPIELSESASTTEFPFPAYDWNKQTRHDTIIAGRYTVNSIQTFDNKGLPKDAKSDNND
jgi:hypothetical protein